MWGSRVTVQAEAVIVGAGPCGLFAVFELGLLGIQAHVVDSLRQVGGQCMELYPDKPIFDIPAVPACSARELIENLKKQIEPFNADFHLEQEVTELRRLENDGFHLRTGKGLEFQAGAVVIAGGVGSFQPRRLGVDGAERYEEINLAYRVLDPRRYEGKRTVVLGGGDSALDWALQLYERAASLVLVHRRGEFRAAPASVERMKELAAQGRMEYRIGRVRKLIEDDGRLVGIRCLDLERRPFDLSFDELLVFYGLTPKLGPIAEWGLELDKKQVEVDTECFQTSVPGIFAIGDINVYPGKKKLILSGFHEAALAAFGVERHLYPDKKQFLQYTTTSPRLHKRLGVTVE